MSISQPTKEVVLSGIRPTGKLHLGNYLGAIRHFVRYSNDPTYQCFFFVADLHALTTVASEGVIQIKDNLFNIILDYLAAGIDPGRAVIFTQSSVPETTQLSWILACLTPLGDLERMPTYKDKVRLHSKNVNAGLLNYPVLMAADILGPKSNLVPVGKDQKPHLEMAVELARRFNRLFGETFPVPEALESEMITVPGLDGTGKMGKSEANTINLNDSVETVKGKIRVAVTDPARKRKTDKGTPSKCNIFVLHTLVSSDEEMRRCADGCRTANIGCTECKSILAKNVSAILTPLQDRRRHLTTDLARQVLANGNKRARRVITNTVDEICQKLGLVYQDVEKGDTHE